MGDQADTAPHDPVSMRALCVSVHDVAPATWPACQALIDAVQAVAGVPLTLLVVPRFHSADGGQSGCGSRFHQALADLVACGHELALHGYTHLDDGPDPRWLAARLQRRVATTGEGEFSALGVEEARGRIELGLRWFAERGWHPAGFVPPAWLLGADAWAALRQFPFAYTTTYRYLHLLPGRQALWSPSLVYTARNRLGRRLSPPAASLLARALRGKPLVRLALHPRDAAYPALVRHAQHLIAYLLDGRTPMTKASAAARWACAITSRDPSIHPAPSGAVRNQANTMDRSAGRLPWR